jgi:hypothetical protein
MAITRRWRFISVMSCIQLVSSVVIVSFLSGCGDSHPIEVDLGLHRDQDKPGDSIHGSDKVSSDKPIRSDVTPNLRCGDKFCDTKNGEECKTCPLDCGSCTRPDGGSYDIQPDRNNNIPPDGKVFTYEVY